MRVPRLPPTHKLAPRPSRGHPLANGEHAARLQPSLAALELEFHGETKRQRREVQLVERVAVEVNLLALVREDEAVAPIDEEARDRARRTWARRLPEVAALLVMRSELALERVERGVHRGTHLLFLLRGAQRGAGTGRDDGDLFGAAQVVGPVLQCHVHAEQLGIALGEVREPLVDEGAPLGLHVDVLGLDLDVHTSLRCNQRTRRRAGRRGCTAPNRENTAA
jgi:hypothetical protein